MYNGYRGSVPGVERPVYEVGHLPNLAPSLRMNGVIPLLLDAFMAWTGTVLPFNLLLNPTQTRTSTYTWSLLHRNDGTRTGHFTARHGAIFGRGGILPLFITWILNVGDWSASCPGNFTPGKGPHYLPNTMLDLHALR